MNEKNKRKMQALEENILKNEMAIEKWESEIKSLRKNITEAKNSNRKIEENVMKFKYAEVFDLIKSSQIDPSVALSLIQDNINHNHQESNQNSSNEPDVVDYGGGNQ